MGKRLVIIDLHCDPTMPAGASEAGGGNVYMRQLLQLLGKTGLKITYFTRKKYQKLEDRIELSNGIEFYRLSLGDWGADDKSQLQKYCSEAIRQIRSILTEYNDDQFIFHSSYWQSGKIALELSVEYHTFFVHTVLSNAKRKALQKGVADDPPERIPWEMEVFCKAKHILCSSDSEAKDIIELYGIPGSRILVTGLVTDESFHHPDYDMYGTIPFSDFWGSTVPIVGGIPQTIISTVESSVGWWASKCFLYFGRLHADKGLDHIIEAWSMLYTTLREKTPPLWIVGGTVTDIQKYRTHLLESWRLLDVWESEHRVVWWGTLRPSSISTLMLRTQAVITHSRYESAGLVILEAMTRGIPVIATPFGYGKDLVRDWYNGFQVPYADTQLLYLRLLLFWSQPYLHYLMGKNAQTTASVASRYFCFEEKHLFSYGFRNQLPAEQMVLNESYSIDTLVQQPLDAYPYLISHPNYENIKIRLEKVFEEKLVDLRPVCDNCSTRFLAQMDSKGIYLVILLSARLSQVHMWNRFATSPHVITVAMQLERIKQFGTASGLYSLEWESMSEGLAILTYPKGDLDTLISLETINGGTLDNSEILENKWMSLEKLIRNTDQLKSLLPVFLQKLDLVQDAISLEPSMPTVQFIPEITTGISSIAQVPFELAKTVSLPAFFNYMQVDGTKTFLEGSTCDSECNKMRIVQAAWAHVTEIEAACKRILLQG